LKTLSKQDPFVSADRSPGPLRGVAIYSGSPRLAELAIRIGFDTVWIEMEHGPTDFAAAEAMCHAAESAGGFASIRVPDGQRCHVLRALEVGARVVIVPMVNTAEQACQAVQFGKFPPIGHRGYNTRSRAVGFGLADKRAAFAAANEQTHLFVQVETVEAAENLDAICGIEGLSGILIGPGDLSMSLGCDGDLLSPRVIDTATGCIRRARAAGRHAGILVGPGPLLDASLAAGADLVFCGGDVTDLIPPWTRLLEAVGCGGRGGRS
jgi:2-keto-3-deoxy-L-rhamnonate aldolase RhmA